MRTIICVLFFLLFTPGVVHATEKTLVFVSILPQKFFVEKLAQNLVDVEVMVQPGASPATYEIRPSQLKKLSQAAIFFTIGVNFERAWLKRCLAINPNLRIVQTDQGIEKRAMASHHHKDEHRHAEKPSEHGLDPHIWLSPRLVKMQVQTIAKGLEDILPEKAAQIRKKKAAFIKEIDGLQNQLREILVAKAGMRFMVFHPSWGYFADDFKLEQIPIELEGKEPKISQLQGLIKHAREKGIHVIFTQPQFSEKSARLIAKEIGGRVVPLDPLAENWLENMKKVTEQFRDTVQ
ncbi:MAG: cation ABC transporter substrate-binding protein [Deltaproteobacteria bacterium]|nr:MAG: cation ABC transporter substrate-binding protein [Deltaproteobacteria bacterium]